MAGDFDLGNRFVAAITPLIWQASARPNFVGDVQAMRERVADLLPAKDADRELKLGRGDCAMWNSQSNCSRWFTVEVTP